MIKSHFNYFWPGQVRMGAGVVGQVAESAADLGAEHIFIVVDPGILGLLNPVKAAFDAAGMGFTVYDGVISNPDVPHIDRAAAAFHASEADLVLGFGGGSALDTAKGVRLLAGAPEGGSSADFMSTARQPRPLPSLKRLPPMIAVPTTAGTGSEATPWGVVTDPITKQKAGLGGTRLVPNAALLDPELTVGLPPFLTAATGMDALSHLIEAYVSTNRHTALDSLILYGIRLVAENLPQVVANPADLHARQKMLEAALLGGIAISSNWLGACHALAHQLSTFADVHHGLACALMLPPQIRHARPAAADRYSHIAAALAPDGEQDPAAAVEEFIRTLGLPPRLSAAGVPRETIPLMAEHAVLDLNWSTNPLPLDLPTATALFEEAW